jgi:hypothetical protein
VLDRTDRVPLPALAGTEHARLVFELVRIRGRGRQPWSIESVAGVTSTVLIDPAKSTVGLTRVCEAGDHRRMGSEFSMTGHPDDPEERKADVVARRVADGLPPSATASIASSPTPGGQLPELGSGAPLADGLRC